MMLAEGVAEAQQTNAGFASPDAAAEYWAHGTQDTDERTLSFAGADGNMREARLYPTAARRGKATSDGTLLFIHGGGWAGGSIPLNHRACRLISAQSGWDVLSISYRLAPDHPYPAGLEDCRAAYRWLRASGRANGWNIDRIALGGASAGGNLALSLALSLDYAISGLLLFYPVTSDDFGTDSYTRYAEGFGLGRARMQELFDLYDPGKRRATDAAITPLSTPVEVIRAAALPLTSIIAAECDVLADDSRKMALRLQDAGVPVDLHIEPGVTHGFINRGRLIPAADACLSRAATYLESLT